MICALCGEKYSSWLHDYPITQEELKYRVCLACHEILEEIQNAESKSDVEDQVNYVLTSSTNAEPEVKAIIDDLLRFMTKEERAEEKRLLQLQKGEGQQAVIAAANLILTTSGYNFEGYRIVEHFGFMSAEFGVGLGVFKGIAASFSDFFGTKSNAIKEKLEDSKTVVMRDLKVQAVERGANAIIGMDLDYTMFGDSILGVVASGTAVKIEKL